MSCSRLLLLHMADCPPLLLDRAIDDMTMNINVQRSPSDTSSI